ncbi:MAG: hypothetical protein PF569_08035 [Candidatus Woesearchaeota archaeon]|jgi:hypothetical protein|nr:hypothetical protein [Candidatus Woesearchaeota archaeon]
MVKRELKKLINEFFPNKQALALLSKLNMQLKADPNSNDYYYFRNARNKLLLMNEILKFPEIQDLLNDNRYKFPKKLNEDRLNLELATLDLMGLGPSTIERLVKGGIITTNDFLNISFDELINISHNSLSVCEKMKQQILELVIIKKI